MPGAFGFVVVVGAARHIYVVTGARPRQQWRGQPPRHERTLFLPTMLKHFKQRAACKNALAPSVRCNVRPYRRCCRALPKARLLARRQRAAPAHARIKRV